MKPMSVAARRRGFTLIEVMTVVAIVAILAAIAYPSYASFIRKGKRATAQTALMDIASRQQNYLLDRRVYTNTLATLGFSIPSEIRNDYTITITCSPADCSAPTGATAFVATATPQGRQAGGGERTLSINAAGTKSPAATGYWGN